MPYNGSRLYVRFFCEFETLKFKYMMQLIEMTHSEKVEMYRMIEKDRLIEMLIEANNVINRLTEAKNLRISDVSSMYCGCQQSQCYLMNGSYICATCNRPLGK